MKKIYYCLLLSLFFLLYSSTKVYAGTTVLYLPKTGSGGLEVEGYTRTDESDCSDTPRPSNICSNGSPVGTTTCAGETACIGGDTWAKYSLLGCYVNNLADDIHAWIYNYNAAVYSTADKCSNGSNNPPPEAYLRSGSCSGSIGSIYKTCCSNTTPSYVINDPRSGMGGGNSCVSIVPFSGAPYPPYDGVCPGGSTSKKCGYTDPDTGEVYPACGQETCGPLPTPTPTPAPVPLVSTASLSCSGSPPSLSASWSGNSLNSCNIYYYEGSTPHQISTACNGSWSGSAAAGGTYHLYASPNSSGGIVDGGQTTCPAPPPTCQAPTLSANGVSQTQINLSWNAVSNATYYRGLKRNGVSWVEVFNNLTGTSYSAINLPCGTAISYYVDSHCGSSVPHSSNTASGTTFACTTPTPTPTPTPPPPPNPSVTPLVTCINQSGNSSTNLFNIQWLNNSQPVTHIDISQQSNFSTYYNKASDPALRTANTLNDLKAPPGFSGYQGVSGALTMYPNVPYYTRLFNGSPINYGHNANPQTMGPLPACTTPTPTPTPTWPLPPMPAITKNVSCVNGPYSGSEITINWLSGWNSASDRWNYPVTWVDISANPNFPYSLYYHKQITNPSSTFSTFAPTGFNSASGLGALITQPGITYYVQLFNNDPNNDHSPVNTFYIPLCGATPTPTPTPPSSNPPNLPTNLSASCPEQDEGKVAYLSWDAPAGEALSYRVIIRDSIISFTPPSGLSPVLFNYSTTAGSTYSWSIAACNSNGCSADANGLGFTCWSGITPWIQVRGDVHSNTGINAPGGP